jgi:malate permease and related proteins
MVESSGALFLQLGFTVVLGFLWRKAFESFGGGKGPDTLRRTLNRVVLWFTMPALVFQTVHAAPLGPSIVQAPAAAIAGMAGTALVAWFLLARLYGRTPETGGLVLAASAGSVSFFGIPIVRALFGPEETLVAVYFAVLNVPLALISAAVISSRIERSVEHTSRLQAVLHHLRLAGKQLLTTPATWALIAGVVLQGVSLGHSVDYVLSLASKSVAPTTMFALGLGLHFERSFAPYRMALPAVAIKLAISPLVVFVCAWAFGLSGLPLAVVSLQGAMPTQVLSVVVAERFRLNSRLVGLTLAIDTALAFIMIPLVAGVARTYSV